MAEPLEILDLPRESWTLVEAARAQARRLGDRPFLPFSDGEALRQAGVTASTWDGEAAGDTVPR